MIRRLERDSLIYIVLTGLLLLSTGVSAQKQANIWYFGEYAGLTFEQNDPMPLHNSGMISFASPSVASDPLTGNLLFYSNGEQVWNGNHEVMPNGSALTGDSRSTNNAYIVPVPNMNNLYYLFTLIRANYPAMEGAIISYSIIDMSLAGGLGDVLPDQKNIFLSDEMTEKIAVVPKSNEEGFWLVTHRFNTNHFLVYSITENVVSAPVTYATGESHNADYIGTNPVVAAQGHMKPSPDGTKLAVTLRTVSGEPKPFQLFDFDAETGEVSNPVDLGTYNMQFGVSFSPNSKKLYLHGIAIEGDTHDWLWQFDLEAPDVLTSRTGLMVNNPNLNPYDFGAGFANFDLQLGPDGRLYGAGARSSSDDQEVRNSLIVINTPNDKGYACDVTVKKFQFGDGKVNIGLPNFIQAIFKDLSPGENPNAPCGKEAFRFFPNPVYDNMLNIKLTGLCNDRYTLMFYDVLGRVVSTYEAQGDTNLDLSTLAASAYIVRVSSHNSAFTVKLVKI